MKYFQAWYASGTAKTVLVWRKEKPNSSQNYSKAEAGSSLKVIYDFESRYHTAFKVAFQADVDVQAHEDFKWSIGAIVC